MLSSVPADIITSAHVREWPALGRHETRAVLLVEFFETPPYRRRPRAFREVQRSAAERREAGAEDHARTEQIGIRHHALAQAGHGLIEVTEQQALGDVRRRFVTLGGFHQHRLVILVDVKSFAALLAQFTGRAKRSMWRTKAAACFSTAGDVNALATTSTCCICATGLKKCTPTRRSGRRKASLRISSGMLDVLVASSASGRMIGSISR